MSSKLRKLKQQAYDAGRKRDWAAAAAAYAEILELDKNNPSLLNEYGDACLRMGESAKAVRQFLSAAAKYRQTGLLNNAQAVYKKVLRHEPENVNANWFLAEIRAGQGLAADGEQYALAFLAAAEDTAGDVRELFQKRCLELFTLYAGSAAVLERVERVFRLWDMKLESARAGCLRACLHFAEGAEDDAAAEVARVVAAVPEVVNYAEHTAWLKASGQAVADDFADVNAIALDDAPMDAGGDDAPGSGGGEWGDCALADEAASDEGPVTDEAPETPDAPFTVDEPVFDGAQDAGDGDAEPAWTGHDAPVAQAEEPWDESRHDDDPVGPTDATETEAATPTDPYDVEKDEDGCISIDMDGDADFSGLIEAATEAAAAAAVPQAGDPDHVVETADAGEGSGGLFGGTVNLLDEILAEEGEDILRSSDTEQVSTIASEIGRNLQADEAADPASQYQQGLVYLEMGLHDQAALAFSAAAEDAEHALQAREMWGIALRREGRLDEALTVLEAGLAASGGDASALGLRYQAGRILEDLGRGDEAQEHYRRVHAVDAGFADVARRLRVAVS